VKNCPPPYRPLRGAEPPHFVDRSEEDDCAPVGTRAAALAAYTAGPHHPRFHQLVVSGPAMGKTALLRAIGRQASRQLDWAVAFHHCRPKERALGAVVADVVAGMRRQWPAEGARLAREVLVPRVEAAWPLFAPSGSRGSAGRGEHPAGRGLVPIPQVLCPGGEASWSELKQVLELAGRFADGLRRGLLLVFDDADRLGGGEAESLGHLARGLCRAGLPVALLLSGSLQLGERFTRVGNFSATVWPARLDRFDDAEAREALLVPATDRGVDFDEEALELICLAAGGSPLEVQRLGFAAWSAARQTGVVGVADVEDALGLVGGGVVARAS